MDSEPKNTSHTPLDETLSRAAARIAADGKGRRRSPPVPAAKPPAAPGAEAKRTGPPPAKRAEPAAPQPPLSPPPSAPPAKAQGEPAPPSTPEWASKSRPLVTAVLVAIAGAGVLVTGLWVHGRAPLPPVAETRAADPAPAPPQTPAPVVAPAPATATTPPRQVALVVRSATPADRREIVHTVAPGETLWSIAGHYIHDPWSYRQLAARNNIANPDLIHPGDQVRIIFEPVKP